MLLTLIPSGSIKSIDKLSNEVLRPVILSLLKALIGIDKLSKEAFEELIEDVFVLIKKAFDELIEVVFVVIKKHLKNW